MNLFGRLFRKAPLPPTLVERAMTAQRASAHRETSRLATLQELPDGDDLRTLAGLSGMSNGTPATAATVRTAQARVAQLIDAGSIDFTALCRQVETRPALLSVAALCKDATRMPQVLDSIDDPALFAQLVVESPSSRVRQSAAERVQDPLQLRQLLKLVRNKDKSVYKIVREKCDKLDAEERKAAAVTAEIEALCASLERHSHRSYDPTYPSTLEHLDLRWQALTPRALGDLDARAGKAIARCREVIAAHLRQAAELAARQAAQQAAERTAREALEHARVAAETITAAQADADAQHQQAAALARQAEEAARAAKRAAEDQVFRQIGGLIRQANAALSDGSTQKAAGLRRAVEGKLPTASAVPPHITRQLQHLDAQLNRLKEWKDYAVAPKRTALIEEMEALVGSTEEPKILADRIKSLQQEWRTISKGIVSETPAEWERFHQASQAAYQPCRDYFDAQATLRQENLDNRKAVLDRLLAFESALPGEGLDWRLLSGVLREAPQEWRRYFPVDREANRAIQSDFDAALGRLQARLHTWYEGNATDKQSLIQRARQLLTQEDGREAIEAVKQLQIQWKETGPVPRDQDQSLWNDFREVCDAVYQKRQQAYAEYNAGLDANKVSAVTLCEEVDRVTALSGAALLEGAERIPEWLAAFDALGEMPRTDARALQDRFHRALESCRAQVARQHQHDAEQSYRDLVEAGRRVNEYQWAVLGHRDSSEVALLKQAAETFITGVPLWPLGGLQAVRDALANAGALSDADNEGRERALRTLCVRGEIHSDTPTPSEDESLRREYQVRRLMQGMGQGNRAEDGSWDAMILEWLRIGAAAPDVHRTLQERFLRSWARRPQSHARSSL
jgi:hypothetical protein